MMMMMIMMMMMVVVGMMMVKCFCGMVDGLKAFSLIPVWTIARDPRHLESRTRRQQDLNLFGT